MASRPRRGFPARYVTVEYKIWPAQNTFVRQYAIDHNIAINEAVRRIFAHAMECPLFNPNDTDAIIAPRQP